MSIFNMFSHTFQCSSSCGYGQKSRDIWCVDLSRRKVSDALCNPESKPESSAACYGSKCSSQWKHGDWSPVSRLLVCYTAVFSVVTQHSSPQDIGEIGLGILQDEISLFFCEFLLISLLEMEGLTTVIQDLVLYWVVQAPTVHNAMGGNNDPVSNSTSKRSTEVPV